VTDTSIPTPSDTTSPIPSPTFTPVSNPTSIPSPTSLGCTPIPSAFNGVSISPLTCEQIKQTSISLLWNKDEGGLSSGNGIFCQRQVRVSSNLNEGLGTGFTMILPASSGVANYLPSNLSVDTSQGRLVYTTTSGIMALTTNSQQNALGIGLTLPSYVLWFGLYRKFSHFIIVMKGIHDRSKSNGFAYGPRSKRASRSLLWN
jgi:hypothetical protein